MTRVISVSTGINLVHHISKANTVTFFFFLVCFETDIGGEHVRNVFKKIVQQHFFFSEESPSNAYHTKLLKLRPIAMYTYLQQALPRVVIHLTKEAKKKWKLRARFSPTKENRLHQTKISTKTD